MAAGRGQAWWSALCCRDRLTLNAPAREGPQGREAGSSEALAPTQPAPLPMGSDKGPVSRQTSHLCPLLCLTCPPTPPRQLRTVPWRRRWVRPRAPAHPTSRVHMPLAPPPRSVLSALHASARRCSTVTAASLLLWGPIMPACSSVSGACWLSARRDTTRIPPPAGEPAGPVQVSLRGCGTVLCLGPPQPVPLLQQLHLGWREAVPTKRRFIKGGAMPPAHTAGPAGRPGSPPGRAEASHVPQALDRSRLPEARAQRVVSLRWLGRRGCGPRARQAALWDAA